MNNLVFAILSVLFILFIAFLIYWGIRQEKTWSDFGFTSEENQDDETSKTSDVNKPKPGVNPASAPSSPSSPSSASSPSSPSSAKPPSVIIPDMHNPINEPTITPNNLTPFVYDAAFIDSLNKSIAQYVTPSGSSGFGLQL